MSVDSAARLKGLYGGITAIGDKAINSDAYFEIHGAEDIGLLIKQFPWPTLAVGGEIEVPGPLGTGLWQPQQLKTWQQGQIGFMETARGHIQAFMERIVAQGGRFDATVYEGTPELSTRKCEIVGCFFQSDNPDRDWENRAQVLLITGTLFFHFFGNQ